MIIIDIVRLCVIFAISINVNMLIVSVVCNIDISRLLRFCEFVWFIDVFTDLNELVWIGNIDWLMWILRCCFGVWICMNWCVWILINFDALIWFNMKFCADCNICRFGCVDITILRIFNIGVRQYPNIRMHLPLYSNIRIFADVNI